jgi:preprotein translocase subunit SecD
MQSEKMRINIKFTWKIWLLIILLMLSLIAIFWTPYLFQKGVLIDNVKQNSTAFESGLKAGMLISSINGQEIRNTSDYSGILQEIYLSEGKVKVIFNTNLGEIIYHSDISPAMTVSDLKLTNIQTGLDLSGGARALVQKALVNPEDKPLTTSEVNDLVDVVSNRFNVYGISDINIRPVSDLAGNNFMLIEIAGATPNDLENLVSQQGKFEAKIGNETVFIGGERDIQSIAESGQNSGIYSCNPISDGYVCQFRFTIYLSQAAAERQAAATANLSISLNSSQYLSKTLDLYVDGNLQDTLQISSDLKGRVTTQVSIEGSGTGSTQQDASNSALENMKKLKTILKTGSLPFKLEIVKLDTISPTLGQSFTKYILIAAIAGLLSVALFLFIRYKTKSAFISLFICTAEIIITLGVAAVMKQDFDLPAIAGILAAIGTGVDDQIVILDETIHRESLGIKERIKRAFVIIMGAYFTVVVSLLPLLWVGAGLLKGFAIMTLIGITVGVFITRPAFADMVKKIESNSQIRN